MSKVLSRFIGGYFGPADYDDGAERNYINQCSTCLQEFIGYKARISCRICADEYKAKLDAMTPEERQVHEDKKMSILGG